MADANTYQYQGKQLPSSVMYADFKTMGMSNHDVAAILLDLDRSVGDATVRDRIESRSLLSRTIVHAAPGELNPSWFVDFSRSVPTLMVNTVAAWRKRNRGDAVAAFCEHYAGPAAQAMQEALVANDINAAVYRNAVFRITGLEMKSELHRAQLYFMLFVVTGCTGDPLVGAQLVERNAHEHLGVAFRTPEAAVDLETSEADGSLLLGLVRISGGRLKGESFHRLAPTPQGTEIGSLPNTPDAITDVEADVSRRHARIYCEDGRWYLVGLKSENGTVVISGADKLEHVVEPPRRERPAGYVPQPYEVFPTDVICLGSATRFMVLPITV